ncbi:MULTISPECIES: isopentenyl-diphosphate Delta-isomerase [Actinokineospora]|uniref:isopentenyl-diphosphate Delta-isomerase n=1 Tax=Actinokineospora TaxID=39845 RepID=UPI00167147DF|nr:MULTISPECIES: isopentenyl-diphosphate Delta-isomerase [Actinokineospora]
MALPGCGGWGRVGLVSEEVVLLDESGAAVGTAPKAEVHHRETPLHLAFSSYVFNQRGEFLLTQRAAHKKTWPAVWTNSCCGHPAPGEPPATAVARRLADELGLIGSTKIDLVLPRFRYRAEMDNGVVENEICPVFRVVTDGMVAPNAEEVDAVEWVPWQPFAEAVLAGTRPISPWCALQVRELAALGPDPLAWPAGDEAELPPALR